MDCVEPVGTRVDNKRRMALSKRSEVSEAIRRALAGAPPRPTRAAVTVKLD